jgi:hypothetical protein
MAADERLEWLARLVPDPSLPVPEANAAEVTANGGSVVDALEVLVEAGRVEDTSWAVARLRPYWLIGGNVEQGRQWRKVASRCRSPWMSVRSRHSRRTVRTQRSA